MVDELMTAQKLSKFLIERKCIKIAKNRDEFFTLKSKRKSPIFINMGSLIDGEALDILANAYADKIYSLMKSGSLEPFDFIFGPAYKAISLGALTCASLYRRHKMHCKFLYDRKEQKLHGDVNADQLIVGANQFEQNSKILIIDDVISSGQSKFDTAQKLKFLGEHSIVGVMVAVDRQELGGDENHTSGCVASEINEKLCCSLFSIANMGDIYIALKPNLSNLQSQYLCDYFKTFGAPDTHSWAYR